MQPEHREKEKTEQDREQRMSFLPHGNAVEERQGQEKDQGIACRGRAVDFFNHPEEEEGGQAGAEGIDESQAEVDGEPRFVQNPQNEIQKVK